MTKHLQMKIYGRVQGVFFRANTVEKAQQLGLTGSVRNEPDGTVYIEAEGEEEILKRLLEWCYQGPQMGMVDNVNFEFSEKMRGYEDFKIKH
ncbi:acylphosphatase [Patescibacteria group bacterium]|nr:acylphosphatase [Patescibacteria group bacterium]MBU1868453.1 acylphosphatase [Patescibacteria group bacterium]